MYKYKFSTSQWIQFVTVVTTGRRILLSEIVVLEYEGRRKQMNEM